MALEPAAAAAPNPFGGTSPPKLLDRVRQAIRAKHYSRRTESAYVDWIRRDILFHKKRHPFRDGRVGDFGIPDVARHATARERVDLESGAQRGLVPVP